MPHDVSVGVDISALYAQHRLGLVRMAVLLVDDLASAEDVVQDAFVSLHRSGGRLREPEAALAYLRKSVVNAARSALRRRRTVRAHLRLSRSEHAEASDHSLIVDERHEQVLAAVRRLPVRDQQVLLLRYWSELSEAEIADALGVSRGTVKSTASRALDKLEAELQEAQR
ncbi:MAG: sigma-70 family RNA polymerase sigma factor [Jatrophihabitantaceae bacterium]